jgi:hypothetical protein
VNIANFSAIVINPPNVSHPMERVETLIDKLKEQFDQKLGADKLLITVQLLLSELQQANSTSNSSEHISVVMPAVNANHAPSVEINIIEHKSHKTVHKKDDLSGWLFDQEIEIPTLVHQTQYENVELNDAMSSSKKSLNDELKEEKNEVANVLQAAPVRDLKKAIGVNDRFLFINELFRGDETMYERSIKTINGFNIYPEAEYWIQRELKVKLGWKDDDTIVVHFHQLVKRRFS